jgi:hypothetical protein
MQRFKSTRFLAMLAIATGITILGPATARADLRVRLSVDGGATTEIFDVGGSNPSTGNFSGTFGGIFSISNLSASSNTPGTALLSRLLSTNLDVSNTSGASHTLRLEVSATGFNLLALGRFISNVGGTLSLGSGSLTLQSFAGLGNGDYNNTGATPGLQTINPLGSSYNNTAQTVTGLLATPYSMYLVLNLTLGAGGSTNFTTSALLQAVPEPATLTAALVGLISMGAYRLRRRTTKAVV